jgi:hypothetical protein
MEVVKSIYAEMHQNDKLSIPPKKDKTLDFLVHFYTRDNNIPA